MTVWCSGCCTTCGRHFRSEVAFDLHRTGRHEVTADCWCKSGCPKCDHGHVVVRPSTRRCLDPATIAKLEPIPASCRRGPGNIAWRVRVTDAERERLARMRGDAGRVGATRDPKEGPPTGAPLETVPGGKAA